MSPSAMSVDPMSPSLELLLQETSWVRRLARSLVADANLAEDLAQDTLVKALEHRPSAGESLRGWLATVMRNLVRERRRAEGRRRAREERAARNEALASSEELVGRLAVQRAVVGAVMELDEPYRTAILLRYFEECPPARIARELGVPVATVKSRLARGLDKLRARLDRDHGGNGRTWCLLLLPLAERPLGLAAPALPLSVGAIALNAKLLLSFGGAAVIGAVLFVMSRGANPPSNPIDSGVAAAPQQKPALEVPSSYPAELLAESRPESTRISAERAPDRAEKPAPPAQGLERLRGRVIDVEGRPIAGIEVRQAVNDDGRADPSAPDAPGGVRATTDVHGRFELETQEAGGVLLVADDRFVTVLAGKAVAESTRAEAILVAAPRLELAGTVLDQFGLPLEGAGVRVVLPEGFRGRFAEILDFSVELVLEARSREQGLFELELVPFVAGAKLVASKEGYLPSESELPPASLSDLVLVLSRPPLASSKLAGVVVDPLGLPIEGARVSLGMDSTRSDEEGRFSFDLAAERSFNQVVQQFLSFTPDALIAVMPGFLPATFVAEDRDQAGAPIWPDHVVLRLGASPLSIEGRVVGQDGEARQGIQVWVADLTFFGGLGDPAVDQFPALMHVETLLAGLEPGWNWAETDEDGEFRIEGLLDREYTLQAMDRANLLRAVVEDVAAGRRNVRIELPEDQTYPWLRGTVVDHSDRPVEGVRIGTMCDAFQTRFAGQVISTQHGGTDGVVTDDEGRFELQQVPKDLVYLRLDGTDTIPLEWGRGVVGGLASLVGQGYEDLVITVSRRCHFQVELSVADEADEVAVLDAQGEELVISEFLGNGRREMQRFPIQDGRTNTLGVGDEGKTLVLFKGGEEVRRVPLQLVPGERVVLRL